MQIHWRRAFLALTTLCFALTGCADSESGTRKATGGGTASVVRLAFFPNVTHAVALMGTGKDGAFARALGADARLEERTFTAGPAEIEALFANEVDIGFIGPGPAVNGYLKSRGRALRIIAGASSGGAGLVVRSDSGIAHIAGLAGKRVAVPQTGGTQDISLRHALQEAGLAPTEERGSVSVLQMAPADTLNLFRNRQLDAAWVPEPWVTRLVQEGNGTLLIDERDRWPDRKFATTVVIARTQFLEEHPDLVRRFLQAHVETVARMQKKPEETRRIVAERIKELSGKPIPEDIVRAALERTDITHDPLRASVLTFADWARTLGYLRQDRSALETLIDVGPLNEILARQKQPPVQ